MSLQPSVDLTGKRRIFAAQHLAGGRFDHVHMEVGHLRGLVLHAFNRLAVLVLGRLWLSLLSLAFLLLFQFVLVLHHHLGQVLDVLVRLREQERQSFIFLLIDQLAIALLIFGHQSTHSLLFDSLLFFLLFALRVRVVRGHRLVHFADLRLDVAMVLLELLRMLQNGRQVFLVLLLLLLLLLQFLLLLQLLGQSGIAQTLPLRTLVELRIQRGL